VAGLTPPGFLASRALLALVALLAMLAAPPRAIGADPAQTPRPPTCAERYPAEGPAGVDLRLGCIVSEVVGLYRPDQASPPPTLSTYAIALAAAVGSIIGLALIGTRLLARHAGARLAPTTPDAWWVCPSCHSINGIGVSRCYSCSTARPTDMAGALLPTSEQPVTTQSFGRAKHE
jgi:hypothetical protein